MDAFYEAIDNPKKDGAIFFAVCRGKVHVPHKKTTDYIVEIILPRRLGFKRIVKSLATHD